MQDEGVGFGLQFGPDILVAARDLEVVDHRPDVEAGTAHQDRPRAPLRDALEGRPGGGLEPRDRVLLGGVGEVEEVVRHLGAHPGVRRGRPDVHAPVERHGVH